jgi:hypothetical protein
MTATTLDLASAPVLLRAANRIVETGLARDGYTAPGDDTNPDTWPVDALGAIAAACGLPPKVWENDHLDEPGLAAACEASDLLVLHLGLNPEDAYDETLGDWSDEHTVEQVVTAMRAAAKEASHV